MDKITINNSVKKIPLFLLLFAAAIFTASCDTVINQVGELPEDPEEGASNPSDPKSDDFRLPSIQLLNGFSLDEPFTVTSRDVFIQWEVVDRDGFPVDFDYSFSYRLASPLQTISEQPFIEIGTEQTFSASGLNETFQNQFYEFEINAFYDFEGENSKDTTFTGQFAVDAIQSRGFIFNPVNITENNNGSYTAAIYLDEIEETDDLTALSLVINYNRFDFNVSEADITVFSEAGSFLHRDGGEVISFVEIGANVITIDVGVAGSNLTPLSGGGAICEINFNPTSTFSGSSSVSISTASKLKSSDGSDIEILVFDNTVINQ